MNRQGRRSMLKEVKKSGDATSNNVESIFFAAQNFQQRARALYEEYMIVGSGINIDACARLMMSLYDLTYSPTNPEWARIVESFSKFKAKHPITTEWLAIALWYTDDHEEARVVHQEARVLDSGKSIPWIHENDKWFFAMSDEFADLVDNMNEQSKAYLDNQLADGPIDMEKEKQSVIDHARYHDADKGNEEFQTSDPDRFDGDAGMCMSDGLEGHMEASKQEVRDAQSDKHPLVDATMEFINSENKEQESAAVDKLVDVLSNPTPTSVK